MRGGSATASVADGGAGAGASSTVVTRSPHGHGPVAVHRGRYRIGPIGLRARMADPDDGPGMPRRGRPVATGEPLVVLDGVNKHFGELHVLQDIDLTVGTRRGRRRHRPVRLRQVDAVPHDQPARDRSTPARSRIDGEPLPEEGKALAQLRADVGMVFQCSTSSRTRRSSRTSRSARSRSASSRKADGREAGHGAARPGRRRRTRPTSTPPSSPAASSSAWRSPARWPWSPR